jgi:thioredoxin-dependent peroxiredoxin
MIAPTRVASASVSRGRFRAGLLVRRGAEMLPPASCSSRSPALLRGRNPASKHRDATADAGPCVEAHVQGEKRQKKGISVMVEDGMKAPDFTLPDADGKSVRLSSLKGAPVVVYFYPKDDTSGCTAEAKGFTCLAPDFKRAGAQVLGISPDSPESHRKFQDKYDLGVRLLADQSRAAAEAYGVWVEKSIWASSARPSSLTMPGASPEAGARLRCRGTPRRFSRRSAH